MAVKRDGTFGPAVLPVKNALFSLTERGGAVDLARALHERGATLWATEGTARAFESAGLPVRAVSELVGQGAWLGGRVKTLWLALPAYNEERSLPALLERCKPVAETLAKDGRRLRVLVVDDGSKDRTIERAQAFAEPLGLEVILHVVNRGLGAATTTALLGGLERASDAQWVDVSRVERGRIEIDRHLAPVAAGDRHLRDVGELLQLVAQFGGHEPERRAVVAGPPEGQRHHRHVVDRPRLDHGRRCAWRQRAGGRAELLVEAHERVFGHADPRAPVEIIHLRVQLRGARPHVPLAEISAGTGAPPSGARRIWLDGRPVEAGVYERHRLGRGDRVVGPAIVEQPDTTVLVPAGDVADVDRFGNLIVHREA